MLENVELPSTLSIWEGSGGQRATPNRLVLQSTQQELVRMRPLSLSPSRTPPSIRHLLSTTVSVRAQSGDRNHTNNLNGGVLILMERMMNHQEG